MAMIVCGGAVLKCSFGASPSILNVLPETRVVNKMPVATIMDNKPMLNIMPFGMCSAPMNPAVAAATAAAFGVLTPAMCIPALTTPWAPGSPKCVIAGKPALNNSSKLMCMYGGVIEVTNPGQNNIQVS